MQRGPLSISFFICLACLLAACAPAKGVMVYEEAYWREITRLDPDFQPRLESLAARFHYTLALVEAPKNTNYFEHLKQSLAVHPSDLVVSGPMLSAEIVKIAPLYSGKKFAVLDMPRLDTALPANVIPVYSERRQAFFEAGKLAGAALTSGRFPDIGQKLGVIASGLTRQEKEMLAEFERGFSSAGGTEAIVIEELGTVTDRVKAARAVENLLRQDCRLFLVKAYGLSGACLERILLDGGFFIVEDFSSFNHAPEKLFLSIEDDFGPALEALLQARNFTPPSPPVLPAKVHIGGMLRGAAAK